MKKFVAAVLAIALAGTTSVFAAKKQRKVFNIYCWNEEFQSRFNAYFASKVPADVKINWIITPNQDNAYQNKLDEVLLAQKKAKADDKVDLFLVEADYALKYVDTPYTLDVKKDIKLTDKDLAQQYKYTKDIMTDGKGNLKGVSWQACPGGFIYRRSIAKDVLGTDDPTKVGAALADWSKFDAVAAQAKAKGYFMVSGFDDDFRVFSDNVKSAWVVNGKINVDPAIKQWVKQTKEYTDKGYNNKANRGQQRASRVHQKTEKYSVTLDRLGSWTSVLLRQHLLIRTLQRQLETEAMVTGHSAKDHRASLGVEPGSAVQLVQTTSTSSTTLCTRLLATRQL